MHTQADSASLDRHVRAALKPVIKIQGSQQMVMRANLESAVASDV
jgi:hypothetical protein